MVEYAHSHLSNLGVTVLEFGNDHPLVFIIPCFVFAACSLYQFVIAFIEWRRKNPVMAAFACLGGLAYLWPVSLTAKVAVFGPEILRWYVADLGFVPMFGLIIVRQAFSQKLAYAEEPRSRLYTRMIDKLALARMVMALAFGGITAYELFMGVVYLANSDVEVSSVGSTDPIDLAMYVLGFALGLRLVAIMKKPVEQQLSLAQEIEAKERSAHEAKIRAIKQAKRKQHNRRRR